MNNKTENKQHFTNQLSERKNYHLYWVDKSTDDTLSIINTEFNLKNISVTAYNERQGKPVNLKPAGRTISRR